MGNLKWILRILSADRWSFLGLILLVVAESCAPLLSVYLQKHLIDHVFVAKQFHLLAPLLTALAASMAAADVLYSLAAYRQFKVQAFLRKRLVSEFFRTLGAMPVGHLRRERTGAYMHNVNGDAEKAVSAVGIHLPEALRAIVELLTLVIIVGIAAPAIVLVALALSPVYVALGNRFAPRLKQLAKEKQEKASSISVFLEESISATREVIAFHRGRWEADKFRSQFADLFQTVMKEVKWINLQTIASDPVKWSVHLAALGIGGYAAMRGTMTLGAFVVVYQLAGKLTDSVQKTYSAIMGLPSVLSGIERFRAILDGGQSSPNGGKSSLNSGGTALSGPVVSLQFADVCFRYEEQAGPVLNGLTFHIPIGQKVAFVGASGSGKSTIAQLLIRFAEPDGGSIRVNGIPLSEVKREDWMRKVSIVFQEPYLFPDTIRNNLLMGRSIPQQQMEEACRLARIHDTIMSLDHGYDTVLGERGITLSGGQRQRLAIARALLADAEIMILDEATSALDMETERDVQRNVDEARKGRTTIVIAHRLSAIQNADVIYMLDAGKIVRQGTHDHLMATDPVYRRMALSHLHFGSDTLR